MKKLLESYSHILIFTIVSMFFLIIAVYSRITGAGSDSQGTAGINSQVHYFIFEILSIIGIFAYGAYGFVKYRSEAKTAKDANAAKSRFLSLISHEIRTPMNVILGITEIQMQNDKLTPEIEEGFEKIYDSGKMLLNIINDILDFSKIEAGKLEIIPVKYDLASLINDTLQLIRFNYSSKPIEFILDIKENLPQFLYGDELRLKQIFNNILSNAFKYTEKGRVRMTVSCENQTDDLVTLVFCVSDTGQGMMPEELEKLFDEYTRFNMDANRTNVGTGLGMSITKRLVDLMGGKIFVESEIGQGTVFIVRLLQKRIDSAVCGRKIIEELTNFRFHTPSMPKKKSMDYEKMPHGKVLVVDDVESNLYVAKGMLLPYGLDIDTAASGYEAIEKLEAGCVYDIIFMDQLMPDMDGIETARLIREREREQSKIIALTANALTGQAEMFMENGFDGYLSKPINSAELDRILNRFIGFKNDRR